LTVTRESNALSKAVRVFREHGARAVVAKSRSQLRLFGDALIAARWMRSLPSSMQLEESLRIAYQFSVGEITIAPAQVWRSRSRVPRIRQVASTRPRGRTSLRSSRASITRTSGRVATGHWRASNSRWSQARQVAP
jgi:hypothetical protein